MGHSRDIIHLSKRRALGTLLGIGSYLAAASRGLSQTPAPEAPPSVPGKGPGGFFDVRAFGARGDGQTVDTPAINRAIEASAAAGGGTVRFPAGNYLCFSIHLKSRVALWLERGATVVAAETGQGGAYDPAEPNPWDAYQDFGHSHFHNALLWGEGLENVSILGPGLLWGKGLTRGPNERGAGVGDKTISLKNCHNVLIRDVSIRHGGHFGILATGVDNLTVDNLLIDTNRDGMDIDCCRNVRVSNCTVNSPWDDGICPKSSFALGYARATENVTISNCFVTGGYEEGTVLDGTFKRFAPDARVPRTGRIKCGTESNGGFKNIAISNCVFEDCGGLALESVDGALLEDISITNITMRDISNLPIFLRLGSRLRGPSGTKVGSLRRVIVSNIVVSNTRGRYASLLSGIPGHEIEDVKLSDIYIQTQGGGTKGDAAIQPPEEESHYPEPTMFGTLPACGFYVRHVKGLEASHIEVATVNEDQRPAFVLEGVEDADFLHVKAPRASGVPMFALRGVKDFNLYLSRPLADTHLDSVESKTL